VSGLGDDGLQGLHRFAAREAWGAWRAPGLFRRIPWWGRTSDCLSRFWSLSCKGNERRGAGKNASCHGSPCGGYAPLLDGRWIMQPHEPTCVLSWYSLFVMF
jgi:hypothetical protein